MLTLTYAAIFKIFRIPTEVLGGIIIIDSLIILMNYNHTYSEMTRSHYISTPIVPLVKVRVEYVPITSNQKVKAGVFYLD